MCLHRTRPIAHTKDVSTRTPAPDARALCCDDPSMQHRQHTNVLETQLLGEIVGCGRPEKAASQLLCNNAMTSCYSSKLEFHRILHAQRSEHGPFLQCLLSLGLGRQPQTLRSCRSEEHTSELPVTNAHLVCRLL